MKSADAETERVRHLVAAMKVRRALVLIEDAQGRLDRACAELSSIQFGHPAQRRVRKLYDRVHAEWYRTRKLLEDARIRVDREPTNEERDYHAPKLGEDEHREEERDDGPDGNCPGCGGSCARACR